MNKRQHHIVNNNINNHNEDDRTSLITLNGPSADDDKKEEASDIRGDRRNVAILFFLYLLQGIPLGLTAAIPMLLQNRGASYRNQAEFSFAHWPFSMKLLWAPIVDSVYCKRFGRRKSWLIPVQYLIGIFMLLLSQHVDRWLGGGDDGQTANVPMLTAIFFALNFLGATQDIAVDGWALTMLKRCNVGHASTCNSVGQTAGYFLGYVAFISLESAEFCNTYVRAVPMKDGLITLPGFLWFWGICFLITTTLVAIFKREQSRQDHHYNSQVANEDGDAKETLSIAETYKLLYKITKMPPIRLIAVLLLTVKVTFAASDAVTQLKLIDAGVPKDKLALLAIPMIPLQIILPLVISKYTTGPRPMDVYLRAYPYRIVFACLAGIIVSLAPAAIQNGHVPVYYYVVLIVNYAFYQVCLYSMFVAIMAFFAKISDPAVGGTYMTLLNTVCNLGNNWPSTIVLWLVDVLTWRRCVTSAGDSDFVQASSNHCSNNMEQESCVVNGGECHITIDGYYLECLIGMLYGILWYRWGRTRINRLQNLSTNDWRIITTHRTKSSRTQS